MIDAAGISTPSPLPFAQSTGSFWLPGQDSTHAEVMDPVFYFILGVAILLFALVVGLMIFFLIRYRRRKGVAPGKTPSHNTLLELIWTAIPLAVVGVIFYKSFTAYLTMQTPPSGCYEIRVTAKRWDWFFAYPNGHVDSQLHVPVDEPVRLTMTSTDVIHGISIPAFRVKMDIVPDRYTNTWFRAVRPGTYELLCTEYCGDDHSDMITSVVVHEPGEFEKWLKEADQFLKNLPPAEAGEQLFASLGCTNCHKLDGPPLRDVPPLGGIYGKTRQLTDGSEVVADDNYIRESILDPKNKVPSGYPSNMSTFKGLVTDEEITWLIEYLKTLE